MARVAPENQTLPSGFEDVLSFPFSAALLGRRARRFSMGATIPDGSLAYESRHEPLPLTELEQMLVLTAAGGNTGWHHAITRNATYEPHLPNCAGAAGGRRHIISIWSSTTITSGPAPISARTPSTWRSGTTIGKRRR